MRWSVSEDIPDVTFTAVYKVVVFLPQMTVHVYSCLVQIKCKIQLKL